MNSASITAILNILVALLPTIEAEGASLLADARQIISDVNGSSNATPEQLQAAAALSAQADARQDAIYAALQAQDAADDPSTSGSD